METLQWNQNPAYQKSASEPVALAARTADHQLAEIGRFAVTHGLVPESVSLSQVRTPALYRLRPLMDGDALQVYPSTPVTGEDGMSWDSNPTYSPPDSPSVQHGSIECEFDSRSPKTPGFGQREDEKRLLTASEEVSLDDQCHASTMRSPWSTKDGAFHWMEVIQMRHVGVQTAFEIEDDEWIDPDQPRPLLPIIPETEKLLYFRRKTSETTEVIEVVFDQSVEDTNASPEISAASVEPALPLNQECSVDRPRNVRQQGCVCNDEELLCKTSADDYFRNEAASNPSPCSNDDSIDELRPREPRHGCSASAESDAFNNLPLSPAVETQPSIFDDTSVLYHRETLHSRVHTPASCCMHLNSLLMSL